MVARVVARMLLCKSYIVTRVLSCQEICCTVAMVLKVVSRVLAGLFCYVCKGAIFHAVARVLGWLLRYYYCMWFLRCSGLLLSNCSWVLWELTRHFFAVPTVLCRFTWPLLGSGQDVVGCC